MVITLELTEELQRKLTDEADRLNVSPAELAVSAITKWLAANETSRKSAIRDAAMDSINRNREMLEKLS